MRHWSGSRSTGRSARAPPRRQAVSVCSRRRSASRAGSLPVVAAMWLISARRVSGTARRVEGSRRGLATLRAGLSPAGMWPSCFGVAVEAAQGGDEVFGGAASAAGVAAGDDVGLEVFGELFDLARGGFVEAAGAPVLDDPVPVRAVDAAGAVADGRAHDRDVLGERRRRCAVWCGGQQVGGGDAEPGEQQPGGVEVGGGRRGGWVVGRVVMRGHRRCGCGRWGEGGVEGGGWVDGQAGPVGVGGQEHAVAGGQAAAVAQRGGDAQVALPGDLVLAGGVGSDGERARRLRGWSGGARRASPARADATRSTTRPRSSTADAP